MAREATNQSLAQHDEKQQQTNQMHFKTRSLWPE